MRLNYPLPKEYADPIHLSEDEEIRYCVPYDLSPDSGYTKGGYVAVTDQRLIVLESGKIKDEIPLAGCEDIRCELLVDNGILTAVTGGQDRLVARFSMRHISRFAYVARGAKLLAEGDRTAVKSREKEKTCPKCGRALPGTRECPHCGGRMLTVRKFWRLCRPYSLRFLSVSLFMLLASAIQLAMPAVQKQFIDGVLTTHAGGYREILRFILTMLSLTLLVIVLNVIKNWWCTSLGARISMDLRSQLYTRIQELSLSFVGSRKPGDLMNRIVGDTREIRKFMEDAFGNMLSTLITMAGALVLMLSADWKLTLVSVVFLPVVFLLSWMWRKYIHRMYRSQRIKSDKINSSLQDVISGMRVVKSFGKERAEAENFNRLGEEFSVVQQRTEVFSSVFYPILTFIMGIGAYFVTYFGGQSVLRDGLTVGGLTQFIAYAGVLYGPLGWMTQLPRMLMRMITGLERVYDVLDEEPEIVDAEGAKELEIEGNVSFRKISFGYRTYEPVLQNVSFEVKKGEMIGLVGPSGAGKSTLINLVMRLYNVDSGEILVDGVNINDISVRSLHSQIGVVLQETFLFSGTILNNIRFSKPGASLEEIIRAAKMANAHDFICKMPDGYNTYVGEQGYTLSGGERQRVAIARAILNDPKLLILDEATSSLDTESEYQVQKALERLTKGRTTFAIAHRLSTLRNATRLIVIDHRGIAESGTHNELLARKGIYYGLVTAQLQMYKTPGEEDLLPELPEPEAGTGA